MTGLLWVVAAAFSIVPPIQLVDPEMMESAALCQEVLGKSYPTPPETMLEWNRRWIAIQFRLGISSKDLKVLEDRCSVYILGATTQWLNDYARSLKEAEKSKKR